MKRLLAMVIAMVLVLSGCGSGQSPDVVVEDFCNAMKKHDVQAMKTCVAEGVFIEEKESSQEGISDEISDYFVELSSEMTYSLKESVVNDDVATVTVQFSYVDVSPVMTAVLGEYLSQALALAFSGASEDVMDNLLNTIFIEKKENVETSTANLTIDFPCIKTDDGWKIKEIPSDVDKILTCNIDAAFENSEKTEESNKDGEIAEFKNFIEVPVGTEVEFATIKVKVTECIETNELKGKFADSDIAQNGTKYIVYTIEIENISKETISFESQTFALTDSQGRKYNVYDDGYWYCDSYVTYNDYAPNILQSGNLVYHVPEDCEGYYFALGKAGTEDAYMFMGD